MKRRPVALLPISQHFSIRYFILSGLLKRLSEHVECILVLSWKDDALEAEFRQLGYRCVRMPSFEKHWMYREVRRWVNFVWESDLRSPTPGIDRRRLNAMNSTLREKFYFWRAELRRWLALFLFSWRPGRMIIEWLEDKCFFSCTNWRVFAELIRETKPEVVISATPFITPESILCRVARYLKVRTVGSILSFDNLTSRHKIELAFDHYTVWNSFMKNEAVRIFGVSKSQVSLAGAPQMDFYSWPDILHPREWFLTKYGLDGSRPVILFGAGPSHITPLEPHVLEQLDQVLCTYPTQGRPQILLRPHPVDGLDRWQTALANCRNVILAPAWDVKNHAVGRIDIEDIRLLATTLAYSDVHISTSSTMSLDGAIFDKPQIGLAYDDRPGKPLDPIMVELYEREHYIPLTRSGGIRIVRSAEEMAHALSNYLKNPSLDKKERHEMVRALCGVPIGQATERVADAILSFLEQERVISRKTKGAPVSLTSVS